MAGYRQRERPCMVVGGATSSYTASGVKTASQRSTHLKSMLPSDEGWYPRAQHMAQDTRSRAALLGLVSVGGLS